MVVYKLDHHWRTLSYVFSWVADAQLILWHKWGFFSKSLYLYLYVFIYVDIKEAYNIWLITHLWLPCLLPKSISGYFNISESISPHPVLFMGLLKKRNIYIGIFFLFLLLFCFEIQRLIDSYLNHISLWGPPPFCLFLREQNFQVL